MILASRSARELHARFSVVITLCHSSFIIHPSSLLFMANRDNHYEAALEEYLRAARLPYVAVDEGRRSLMAEGESIKSLDFCTRRTKPPGQAG